MSKEKGSKLEDKLSIKHESSWLAVDAKGEKAIHKFSEDYKRFLSKCKTERETVAFLVAEAKKKGYKDISQYKKLKPGDKVIQVNKKKNMALAVVGKKDLETGFRIVASHIDSPRIDLKQKPLYEDLDVELALFKTHYYGGIKKYQWVNIPLAIHGVVVRADGKAVDVVIGEDEKDPVFVISDLLPHLSHKAQGDRKLFEGIKGEELTVLAGHIPLKAEKDAKKKIKLHVLKLLSDKYGFTEEDLISAELTLVPAMMPRDVGLDRSMVGGYGHDDRICGYTSFRAILEMNNPEYTSIAYFFDKEEIGSVGNTSAQSSFLELSVGALMELLKPKFRYSQLKTALSNGLVLSADVDAGMHPVFKDVHETHNAARIGRGIVLCKYGGARGKSSANDASAEYMGRIRSLFNKNKIPWQYAELGKVDEGGGGTVAKFLAMHNMEIVDCGPAVLSMHSPFEIASKIDIYDSYRAYTAFFKEKNI